MRYCLRELFHVKHCNYGNTYSSSDLHTEKLFHMKHCKVKTILL